MVKIIVSMRNSYVAKQKLLSLMAEKITIYIIKTHTSYSRRVVWSRVAWRGVDLS